MHEEEMNTLNTLNLDEIKVETYHAIEELCEEDDQGPVPRTYT